MERDINLNLVYIILILLVALGGTVIFYQLKYETLRSECESSLAALNETIRNLSPGQENLYENLSELNVSEKRESVLASRLEMKTRQLEDLSIEFASVQQRFFECRRDYDALNVNYTFLEDTLDRHTALVSLMQDKLEKLRSDVYAGASRDVLLDDIQQVQDVLNRLKSN